MLCISVWSVLIDCPNASIGFTKFLGCFWCHHRGIVGYQVAVACSSHALHDALDHRLALRVLLHHFVYWYGRHIRFLSQTPAESKVPRCSLAPPCIPTTTPFIINFHGIVAAKAHQVTFSSRLLVASLHGCLQCPVLLPTHLFLVHSLPFDLFGLHLKVCKGRVATL
jgi:hypothetical protein